MAEPTPEANRGRDPAFAVVAGGPGNLAVPFDDTGRGGSMDDWFERERLHRAAEAGDLTAIQECVGRGLPVNAFDELGKTALHYAVLKERLAVVEFLIRHGANVNAHDERTIGDTPLGEAASTCSLQMARLLTDSGADPTVRGWMQLNALNRAKERRRRQGTGSEGQAVYELLREVSRKRKAR